jgi:hypothetical protein
MEVIITIQKEVYKNNNVKRINNNSLKGNKKTKVQNEIRRRKTKLMKPQCEQVNKVLQHGGNKTSCDTHKTK